MYVYPLLLFRHLPVFDLYSVLSRQTLALVLSARQYTEAVSTSHEMQ